MGPFDGPSGPLTEVGGGKSLDAEGVGVGEALGEELGESPLKGGRGPLGLQGDLIEVVTIAVLGDGVALIIVSVLIGGEDTVMVTLLGPPPGPLFPPNPSVVTTVTVCKHGPLIVRNGWPAVEVTVAVHGAIPTGKFDVVITEIIASEFVLPFSSDTGAAGELELLKGGLGLGGLESGLENVGLPWLEDDDGLGAVVDDGTDTTTFTDTEEGAAAGGLEDEAFGSDVDTDCEVVATAIGVEVLLCAIAVAFEARCASIIASPSG